MCDCNCNDAYELPKGEKGDQGSQGDPGVTGGVGLTGPAGGTGSTGPAGAAPYKYSLPFIPDSTSYEIVTGAVLQSYGAFNPSIDGTPTTTIDFVYSIKMDLGGGDWVNAETYTDGTPLTPPITKTSVDFTTGNISIFVDASYVHVNSFSITIIG